MTILEAMEKVLQIAVEHDRDWAAFPADDDKEAIETVKRFLDEYGQVAPTDEEWASVAPEYRWFAIDGYQGSAKCSAGFSIEKPYFDSDSMVWWSNAAEDATYIEAAPRELPDSVFPSLCLWERPPSEDAQ